MLVRMTIGLSGPQYALGPGDERDFPSEEAIRLIKAGYAVPADGKAETTAKPRAPERRRKDA